MATVVSDIERIVAYLPEVVDAVADELDRRADRVEAVVEAHRYSGALSASLRVERNRTDSEVSISDPFIISINYGHFAPNGRWVEGIHAIEAAL